MNDQELVDFVLRFAGEMNALQRRYMPLLEKARERKETAAVFAACRAEARGIYDRYLTPKKRNYYTPIASPPTYAALEGLTLSTVERKKNRAAVELLTSEGSLDFRFRLVWKDGEWRVSSYQQRCHSGCRIYRWVYEDF